MRFENTKPLNKDIDNIENDDTEFESGNTIDFLNIEQVENELNLISKDMFKDDLEVSFFLSQKNQIHMLVCFDVATLDKERVLRFPANIEGVSKNKSNSGKKYSFKINFKIDYCKNFMKELKLYVDTDTRFILLYEFITQYKSRMISDIDWKSFIKEYIPYYEYFRSISNQKLMAKLKGEHFAPIIIKNKQDLFNFYKNFSKSLMKSSVSLNVEWSKDNGKSLMLTLDSKKSNSNKKLPVNVKMNRKELNDISKILEDTSVTANMRFVRSLLYFETFSEISITRYIDYDVEVSKNIIAKFENMISQKHQELKEEYVLDIKKMFNAVKDEYKEDYIRFWNETAILEDNILSFTDFNNLEKWDIKTYFNKIEAISSLVTITYNKGCKHSSDYSTAINKRNISKISNIKYFLQDMDETIELYKDIERYFNQKIEKLKEELEELFGMNDFYRFRKLYKVDTELNLSFYPTKRSIKINNKIMDINLTEDIKLTIDTIIQGLKQSNIHKFNKLIDDMARIANSREYRHIIDLISYIEYQDIYNYIEILTGSQLSGVKEPQKLESFGALKHLTKFEIYKRIKELVDINFIKIDSFNDNENRCTLCSHNNYLEFVKAIKKNLPSNRITPDYKKKFEQK